LGEVINFDDSHFPVVIQDWSGDIGEADLEQYFVRASALIEDAVANKRKYVTVAIGNDRLSAKQRQLIAEWMNKMPPSWYTTSLGTFVVITSAAGRGLFTALKWLSPYMKDVVAVCTPEEAVTRALQCLRDAGIEAPKSALTWRPMTEASRSTGE